MRMTESRLRRIIRSVILERWDDDKAAKEKQKIAKRIDETGMDLMNLTVGDVKFLLDEIHITSTPGSYIPKFLRSKFPPDDTGHMIISVNELKGYHQMPLKSYKDYKNNLWMFNLGAKFLNKVGIEKAIKR